MKGRSWKLTEDRRFDVRAIWEPGNFTFGFRWFRMCHGCAWPWAIYLHAGWLWMEIVSNPK